MCTSLVYRDAAGRAYFGRTLELTVDLPYRVAWFPAGFAMNSRIADHPPVRFTTRYGVLAITMPARIPTKDDPIGPADLKVLEGLNDQGLTFSLARDRRLGPGSRWIGQQTKRRLPRSR